jgi:hypothetical protein
MHGIDQAKAFLYTAFGQAGLHLGSDIDELPSFRYVEPEFLSE